ncbi:ABC transporter permease [Paraburkholderia sp. J8-2]|uniref:ABC transporter permease n=1 Tax=Paraburkholderia sp. J8-2 TaxID=2805440 RepID=UPI002AB6C092|nr:ABC transporter permease [Paraburkholderia sp. J8-2]
MKKVNRNRAMTMLMLSPSMLIMCALLFVPMIIVVGYSFSHVDSYGNVASGFTVENYQNLLQSIYRPIVWHSLELAFGTTILSLVLAYPVAYFIAFRSGKAAPALLLLILIPFWTNFLIRISAWIVLFGRAGQINSLAMMFGLFDEPVQILGTFWAVQVGMLYAFLPAAVFPIYAALQPMDRRLHEAANDLGAGPINTFTRITLPLSLPGVMAAALFVFVPSMGAFAVPTLLGGGKQLIIGNLIVQLFLDFRNIPFGSAVSVVFLFVASIVVTLYMKVLGRVERNLA